MTLNELYEAWRGKFTGQDAAALEAMEQLLLHFSAFDSDAALELGTEIVRQSKQYGEDIAVCILRRADALPVFQYVGEHCAQRNLDFARRKANTVERTGHCSLWALAKAEAENTCTDLFREENDCLPVGGAFPIFEDGADGQMTALVMTSGLHHGKDHEAVVKALCTVQKKPMPAYHGPLV